jgi:ATP-dependent DNA ligase
MGLLLGYYEGKNLIFVGKIKNGFTPALRRQAAEHFTKLKTTTCPFANLPEPRSARRGEALTADVMKQIFADQREMLSPVRYVLPR